MHAAQVNSWGEAPVYVEKDEPADPAQKGADNDEVQVKLVAAGVHQLVRSRAAGKHYSVSSPPHVPGVDGIGTLPDGTPVYFDTISSGQGSFAEIINLPRRAVHVLPKGLDPVVTAAMVNPGMSSWMAMHSRITASALPPSFTVLILGVTSASGTLATTLVRKFGAGRVIGAGRNAEKLSKISGLDQTIVLQEDTQKTDYSTVGDVDVILDYLYGPPIVHLLSSLKSSRPVQYVQIGSVAGLETALPAAILRSKDITMRGSGPGSWKVTEMAGQMGPLLAALAECQPINVQVEKMKDVQQAWTKKISGGRLVLVP